MVSNPGEPLFDLATLATSDFVLIDGVRYDVVNVRALGLRDQSAIQRETARLLELETLPDPSEEDEAEYDRKLRALTRRIVVALPDEVLAALHTGDMTGLISSFIIRRVRSSAPKGNSGSTPGSSSPESPASTAEGTGS